MIDHAVFAILVVALLGWRVSVMFTSPSGDERRIRERYRQRGENVLCIERDGSEHTWDNSSSLPIRKYRVEVEGLNAGRQAHVIGIQATLFGDPKLWIYAAGERRPIF
jgi:hypothetical protein